MIAALSCARPMKGVGKEGRLLAGTAVIGCHDCEDV